MINNQWEDKKASDKFCKGGQAFVPLEKGINNVSPAVKNCPKVTINRIIFIKLTINFQSN